MSHVEIAQRWANTIVDRESRGSGDTENAMHRVSARYGISWRTFWALRYRPPTDILTSVYFKLEAAYLAELNRQTRLLEHEKAIAETLQRSLKDHTR